MLYIIAAKNMNVNVLPILRFHLESLSSDSPLVSWFGERYGPLGSFGSGVDALSDSSLSSFHRFRATVASFTWRVCERRFIECASEDAPFLLFLCLLHPPHSDGL